MAAVGWKPTVDNYLGRVTKPRILEAVREVKGEQSVQLIDHLKKGDMAREAERLLEGTGWLPEPLRLDEVGTVESPLQIPRRYRSSSRPQRTKLTPRPTTNGRTSLRQNNLPGVGAPADPHLLILESVQSPAFRAGLFLSRSSKIIPESEFA